MSKDAFDRVTSLKTVKKWMTYGESVLAQNRQVINAVCAAYPDRFTVHADLIVLIRMCLHTVQPLDIDAVMLKIDDIKTKMSVMSPNSLEFVATVLDNTDVAKDVVAKRYKKWLESGASSRGYAAPKYAGVPYTDVKQKMIERAAKGRDTKSLRVDEDPLYFKKISPYSKHYDGIKYSIEQRQDLINRTLGCGWTDDVNQKRLAARQRRKEQNLPYTTRHKGSKAAKRFLNPIAEYLDALGILYNWGYDGNTERWVRDIDDNHVYYFIDFAVESLKLAVEFHGTAFHPKSQDDHCYNPPSFVKEKTSADKFLADQRKAASITNAGYTLFVVFDTDDYVTKQKEITEWISTQI